MARKVTARKATKPAASKSKAAKRSAKKAKPAGRAKKAAAPLKLHARLAAHPATMAMVTRMGGCNKPPILWRQQDDGSWLECFLKADCTYGNCVVVAESDVPASVRG